LKDKQNLTISFVIPNWNHKQMLSECIASIYSSDGSILKDVVVVDNASTDGSGEYMTKMYPEIRWIQNDTNRGFAKAVNQGVLLSQGGFLFLLNNDIKLMEDTTEKLLALLLENPDIGAAAPLLFYPNGKIQISCRRFPLKQEEHLVAGIVLQPMASAIMVRRQCWDAVGPLDEEFPIFFNDVDWCYRLYKYTGCKIYLYPDAQAIHHEGASVKDLGVKKSIVFYKGILRFYLKHFVRMGSSFNKHRENKKVPLNNR